MKKVRITLDEETARSMRIEAARRGISVSRLVGEALAKHMKPVASYEAARADFFSRGPRKLKEQGTYPRRDDLHVDD